MNMHIPIFLIILKDSEPLINDFPNFQKVPLTLPFFKRYKGYPF